MGGGGMPTCIGSVFSSRESGVKSFDWQKNI